MFNLSMRSLLGNKFKLNHLCGAGTRDRPCISSLFTKSNLRQKKDMFSSTRYTLFLYSATIIGPYIRHQLAIAVAIGAIVDTCEIVFLCIPFLIDGVVEFLGCISDLLGPFHRIRHGGKNGMLVAFVR